MLNVTVRSRYISNRANKFALEKKIVLVFLAAKRFNTHVVSFVLELIFFRHFNCFLRQFVLTNAFTLRFALPCRTPYTVVGGLLRFRGKLLASFVLPYTLWSGSRSYEAQIKFAFVFRHNECFFKQVVLTVGFILPCRAPYTVVVDLIRYR